MHREVRIVAFGLLCAWYSVARAQTLQPFVGALHDHTGYSDGAVGSTPADAYVRARDAGELRFLAVTEHSEALPVPSTLSEGCLPTSGGTLVECAIADADAPANSLDKWQAQRRQAVSETRADRFLALRGFEWTSDALGHINVYFSRNYTTWVDDGGNLTTAGFYQWLQTPPWLGGGADGLATFNHPDDKKLSDADPRKNWNDFAYVPALDDHIVAIEVFNHRKNYEPWVTRALDKGWHLGVIGAEDLHEADWGGAQWAKTVLLAPRLTLSDLKEAMAARRMVATLDPAIDLVFTGDGRPMGSRIRTGASSVHLEAHAAGGSVARVELLTNGGTVAGAVAGRDLTFDAPVESSERYFLVRVTAADGTRSAYSSPIWIAAGQEPWFTPRWVAGDLHVHTTYSHDSYGGPYDDNTGPDEINTLGWSPGEQIAIAELRGLDYVAITDHNDTRSVLDPEFSSDRLTLVPGYENSLAGHAQMLGAVSCYGPGGRTAEVIGCNGLVDTHDRTQVSALAAALRADGGVFQINHPSDMKWLDVFGDGSAPSPILPDTVEVWNIGPWLYQHPFPASNDNEFSLAPFWQSYLDRCAHVGATGGSDNHWRLTTAVQGVGQPTTWVYVSRSGVAGVLEGLRAGHTFVSSEPPALAGARLILAADRDRDGSFSALPGDTVPAGVPMRIRAQNVLPGASVLIVTDQGTSTFPADAELVTTVPDTKWVRVELRHPDARAERRQLCDPVLGGETTLCRSGLLVDALTSPLYVASSEACSGQ